MPFTQQPVPEHRFAGAYDPAKWVSKDAQSAPECDCGAPLNQAAYRYGGKDWCLGCALEEAGIERRVRSW